MTCERDALQDEMRVLAESSRYTRERIRIEGDCWIWTGSLHTRKGVHNPQGCDGGRNYSPRRLLYERWTSASLARKDYAMPSCCNDRCVRPSHTRIVSPSELQFMGRNGVLTGNDQKKTCKKCGFEMVLADWSRGGIRRYCKFCHNNHKLLKRGMSVAAIMEFRDEQRKQREKRRDAETERQQQREREQAAKLALKLAVNSPRDPIPELSAEYIAEAKARMNEELLRRLQEQASPPPTPPADRKEAIRRRLLAEIEEMAKTRSDE